MLRQDQKVVAKLAGHTQNIKALDMKPASDPPILVSCSFDKTVRLWSVPE